MNTALEYKATRARAALVHDLQTFEAKANALMDKKERLERRALTLLISTLTALNAYQQTKGRLLGRIVLGAAAGVITCVAMAGLYRLWRTTAEQTPAPREDRRTRLAGIRAAAIGLAFSAIRYRVRQLWEPARA